MMVSRRHNGLETRSASGVMRSAFFGWGLTLVLSAGLLAPLLAQQPAGPQEVKVRGVILERSADSFTLREYRGTERMVNLDSLTEVKEEKKNFLRPPLAYTPGDLIPGLDVQVEGLIMSGRILAETIRFTQDALRVARAITTRVEPIETGLAQAQMGLETTGAELKSLEAHTEQQGQKLSGDIDDLADAMMANKSEVERVGVQAAAAVSGAEAANQRLSQLDQYQSEDQLTIHFPAGSATISGQDQAQLDVLAERIAQRKGYLIEIRGFASSDGNPDFNRQLSQRRADQVRRYLVEHHPISLRRFLMPLGYGATQPAGDNATPEGRQMNRRVEVRLLLNPGLQEE